MTDYAELKRLAEAAEKIKPGRWIVHRNGLGPEFESNPRQTFGVDDAQGCVVVWHGVGYNGIPIEEIAEHIAAANPAAVLALVAENERLQESERKYEWIIEKRWRPIEQEREQLKAENERLKQFETAYIEWSDKSAWVRESVEVRDLGKHEADVIKERFDQLRADLERQTELRRQEWNRAEGLRMRVKELDLMFGRYLLGMRAAVIEMECGKGAEAGMRWIWNGLAGPGELPPEDETDAQAYFDREIKAVDAGVAEVMDFFSKQRVATKEAAQ